ncbi:hypothetical protein TOPH_01941 [Tolypocladium ophioglossoides CBS 100239]|uniref:VOC domain-containing protein n=1 Tax=Tolypocladium ophioglossoides (strain CBS 100239) TaxID=1163406 RepID=A0A0L0NHG7_TOLOC|nr:hypothetical protein TOPH_01941 [Tolypocladium ophioglossoides CBS 100239]
MAATPPFDSLATLSAVSLFTDDLPTSKAFYTGVFAAKVLFEDADSCAVKFSNVIVNLLRVEAAAELVAPAAVGARDAGKRFQMTVWVDDLDDAMDKLKQRGVDRFLVGPETKPWGLRVVTFEDPAGHSWEVAQDITK